jgi:hypothetical protein
MKIVSIELKGYKFLALSNINFIQLRPENKLQLILGTNGSGKSSLLKECSPLPANPSEFTKDGYKLIDITVGESFYSLKSSFSSTGNKFSFMKDNEELNPGLTVTVYKELVKKHFNYTPDIHDIMLGVSVFHRMSTMERRSWFTKISDSDYSYAISFYQRLREQLRDVQGASKLCQSRLVQETEKLLDEAGEAKYRAEVKELDILVSTMLQMISPIQSNESMIKVDIRNLDSQLAKASKLILDYRKSFINEESFKSVTDIEQAMIDTQAEIGTMKLKVDELCIIIDKKQQTMDIIKKANLDNIKNIDETLDKLDTNISALTSSLSTGLKFTDNRQALQALLSVQEFLTDIVIHLPDNPDKKFSRDNYIALLDKHKQLMLKKTHLDEQQLNFVNRKKELEHFKEHNQIECPNCQHLWYKGYDEGTYLSILANISSMSTMITEVVDELAIVDTEITDCKQYLEYQRSYIEVNKAWSILNPLWKHIQESMMFFNAPRQILTLIDSLKGDLQTSIEIDQFTIQLTDAMKVKETIAVNEVNNQQSLDDEIESLNKQLGDLFKGIESRHESLNRFKLYKDMCNSVKSLEGQIKTHMDDRSKKVDILIDTYKREALVKTINHVKLELSNKEQILSKIDVQKALVKDLESQLESYSEKIELLKIAVKELSPSNGLIAKGLTGFINHFLRQVNSFIKQVWSYPLELLPVVAEESEVDLDYKFPFKINDSHIASDVIKGSSAMKEVIDLAFKVVSAMYLGLTEFPLYLDEPSRAFDSSHRVAMFKMIDNFLLTANFSQVFMISHYENCYGCIANTDITVLCSNNIVLPRDAVFNKQVVIN